MFEQNYWSSQAAKRCKTLLWKPMGRTSGKCPSCKQSITIFHQKHLQSFPVFFSCKQWKKVDVPMVFQSKITQHTNHQASLTKPWAWDRSFPSEASQTQKTGLTKNMKHIGANQVRFVVYSVGVQDLFHQQYGVKTEKISLLFPSGTLSFTNTQASLDFRVT